jgi:hypothetical protein
MSVSSAVGVQLPEHQLVAGPLLHTHEHASSVTQEVSDEAFEAFLIFAEVLAVAAVPSDSILVEEALDLYCVLRQLVSNQYIVIIIITCYLSVAYTLTCLSISCVALSEWSSGCGVFSG